VGTSGFPTNTGSDKARISKLDVPTHYLTSFHWAEVVHVRSVCGQQVTPAPTWALFGIAGTV
jgi:hypothetical protein